MLHMPAKTVYVDPHVHERANCQTRWERMRPSIQCDDIRPLDDDARAALAEIGSRRHGKDQFADDAVFVFETLNEARWNFYYPLRDKSRSVERDGVYCQTAREINMIMGCPFRCAYCGFGRKVTIPLDVEGIAARLDAVLAEHPNQTLWKFSNMTDLPPFEPEYGAVPLLVERFARREADYLMLFTKSDCVDFLLPLEHNGHTIVSWSLSCETVSRQIERRTAPLGSRLAAMRRAEQAGYTVRARLSPIVPVVDWRDQYRDFFERLFEACRPDIVTVHALGWFDFEDLGQLIPAEWIDPYAYARAAACADELRGQRNSPFPHDVRAELYHFCVSEVQRLSPGTPVGLCLETPAMWEDVGPRTGMRPDRYVCNCGPTCAPGNTLLASAP